MAYARYAFSSTLEEDIPNTPKKTGLFVKFVTFFLKNLQRKNRDQPATENKQP